MFIPIYYIKDKRYEGRKNKRGRPKVGSLFYGKNILGETVRTRIEDSWSGKIGKIFKFLDRNDKKKRYVKQPY